MEFNSQKQKDRVTPSLNKLISYLQGRGINCVLSNDFPNAIFSKDGKELRIAHHCLYRYSGIACIYKDKGENYIEAVDVTDQMYMDIFMKPHIENYFNNKK